MTSRLSFPRSDRLNAKEFGAAMMIEGLGMEPQEAPIKVQVVYYLSRAGQLQQPHLIDVTISPHSNGLYLRGTICYLRV